ncbi:MAG: DUF4412 domain-containing protein [Flavobacteriaceae bacterium]|nr:DUF4412 domain-containing protein [Flavobacteriaceae bacterium]
MKNILFILLACIALNLKAQQFTQGKITMTQTMSSDNAQMNAQLSNMKMSVVTFFKGNKSRTETSSAMTGENISIFDGDIKKGIVLMNNPMMGKTYLDINMDVSQEELENIKVEKLLETKTILGYKCQGYNVKTKKDGVEVSMKVFTTDAIKVARDKKQLGAEIDGYPLQMEISMMQMGSTIIITSLADSVKEEDVSDNLFDMTVPEGYVKTNLPKY